jgi:membrane fusion protein, peptide pheromone/bacteriocin exporter
VKYYSGMDYIPTQLIPGTIEFHLFRISKKSQAVYLTMAFMVMVTIISLPFIYVDVSVSAPGFITTQFEQQSLFAPSHGKVVFSRIRSNARVLTGDTLLIIDSKVPKAHMESCNLRKEENKQSIHDLLLLVSLDSLILAKGLPSLVTLRYAADFNSFRKKYLHQSLLVNKRLNDHRRIARLFNQDVVSQLEYETSLFDSKQELTTLEFFFRQQINIWQNDLTARMAEQAVIEAELSNIAEEINKKYLLAPLDGTIIISSDVPIGSYLFLNQRLGELSPEADLIVSAMVFPVNSGYLYKGQKIRVQVDAYNYNQWGMLEANVLDVSDDILFEPVNNLPYYRVRCEIGNDSLVHRNGSIGRVKKGMTVNCRFIQSRESLFTLLVKRADNWLNPSSNKNLQ